MDESRIQAHARRLFDQHRERVAFTPFTGSDALSGLDEAYAIQAALVEQLLADQHDRVAGYKIGLTSPRMQALLGIDSPIAGQVLSGRLLNNGFVARQADYVQLGIECEIAVRLGCDLDPAAAPFDQQTISAAVEAVCPAFELVDDRAADYAVTDINSLVADNSWNAGIVLGEFVQSWPDLAELVGVSYCNGEELDRGCGADVLGHPFVPLCWLANHLASQQQGLRAGDIVATGSMIPTRVAQIGENYLFSIDGLGAVTLSVRD